MAWKFLHTADLHVGAGKKLTSEDDNSFADASYLLRYASMLYQIEYVAHKEQVDVILIVGDLFHTKNATPLEMDIVRSWFKRIGKSFKVLITDGQHDAIKTIVDVVTRYTLLHHLRKDVGVHDIEGVVVADMHPLVVTHKGVDFVLVPFGMSINAGLDMSKSKKKVLAHHITLLGSVAENGRKMRSGHKPPKSAKRVDYWALGDIHKRQRVKGHNAHYPGSPIQHKFGDPEDCGVFVVSTKDFKPKFVPIKSQKLVTVKNVKESKKKGEDLVRIQSGTAIDPKTKLPTNVVKVDLKLPKLKLSPSLGQGLFSSLSKEMKAIGADKKLRRLALREAERIAKDINIIAEVG